MAASRLHKIGTIYTRTSGLLKSGAMSQSDKPLWYDIYEAFPPKVEPRFDRPESTEPIRNILYPEDKIRAKFYKTYDKFGIINLSEKSRPTICQLFVEEYLNQKSKTDLTADELWEAVESSLEARGIKMRRREANETKAEESSQFTKIKFSISDIIKGETNEPGKTE